MWTYFELFLHFDKSIYYKLSQKALFWNSSIVMTKILLDYIKSSRTGDCSLLLQASECVLVWIFTHDLIYYSRHFS